ncbi:hypothetical protein H311_03709, partial [Anncaliia algerae PRA109]
VIFLLLIFIIIYFKFYFIKIKFYFIFYIFIFFAIKFLFIFKDSPLVMWGGGTDKCPISAEIFPEDYLNAGLILAVNFNWALTFAIPYIFKQMYENMGKNAFYFFAIYLIGAFVILLLMFSETKNRKPAFQ